jgi:hypothetical protein
VWHQNCYEYHKPNASFLPSFDRARGGEACLPQAGADGDGLRERGRKEVWRNWIIGCLGIWMIVASFVFNGNPINELAVGMAVAVLGFWTAVQS